jgi:hypothetical protein
MAIIYTDYPQKNDTIPTCIVWIVANASEMTDFLCLKNSH